MTVLKIVGFFLLWILLTLVTVVGYNEWKAHGEQHAFVKQLQAERAQHQAEHEALRAIIQMINQQQAKAAPAGK